MRKILVVDPEESVREGLSDALHEEGYHNIDSVSCSDDAVACSVEDSPEIILMDKRGPGIDSEEAARIITENNPSAIVFLMAYKPEGSENLTFILSGVQRFLDKSDQDFLSNLKESLLWAVQLLDISDKFQTIKI